MTSDSERDSEELAAMTHMAQLFGDLLLFEIDRQMAKQLTTGPVAQMMKELGLRLPPGLANDNRARNELSADFHEAMLQPQTGESGLVGPLVQSLYTEGSYEGQAKRDVLALAEAANFTFDDERSRQMPPDHLGCLLLFWAEARPISAELGQALEQRHFPWALEPLARLEATGDGFYPRLAGVVRRFLATLLGEE